MKGIFGSVATSITVVKSIASRRYGDESVVVADSAPPSRLMSAELVLFPSVNSLKSILSISLTDGVGVVFDGPLQLHEYSKLKFLDVDRLPRLDAAAYQFSSNIFDYHTLFKAMDSTKSRRIDLSKSKGKILDYMIAANSTGGLLELINNVVYFAIDASNRSIIRDDIMRAIIGDVDHDALRRRLHTFIGSDQFRVKVIDKLIKNMTNADGLKLKRAVMMMTQSRVNMDEVHSKFKTLNMSDFKGVLNMYYDMQGRALN